jgi:hypothetical protein
VKRQEGSTAGLAINFAAGVAGAKKKGARLVAGAGIAGWFGFNAVMVFYTYLWRNSPSVPDFAHGRVARMYYRHTAIFFVERWQKLVTFYGLALSLVLVVSAGAAGILFYREALRAMRRLGLVNACAAAAFLVFLIYRLWPLP